MSISNSNRSCSAFLKGISDGDFAKKEVSGATGDKIKHTWGERSWRSEGVQACACVCSGDGADQGILFGTQGS